MKESAPLAWESCPENEEIAKNENRLHKASWPITLLSTYVDIFQDRTRSASSLYCILGATDGHRPGSPNGHEPDMHTAPTPMGTSHRLPPVFGRLAEISGLKAGLTG